MIEVFDNRVVISNPGGLPSGMKPRDFGKKSITRNNNIAALLLRAHYIEKVGTGISRVKEAVTQNGKCSVEFEYTDRHFTVTFWRKNQTTYKENIYISDYKFDSGLNGGLNGSTAELFNCIKQTPGISLKEASEVLNKPYKTLEKQVKKLIDESLVKRVGSKKTGGYVAVEKT
ncbi:MAG: hypothetical protein JXR63_07060, partial [Spirochaetales bacterium]|nr:hypothetical protein [Spirochaetales bacterium]